LYFLDAGGDRALAKDTQDEESVIVTCVWVEANVPFTAEYVYKLRNMVRRNLPTQHRFVCLTDRPEQLPGIETLKIPKPQGMFGWWSKLELFAPEHAWFFGGETVLYLDLDVLVVGSLMLLGELVEPPTLTLVPDQGTFQGSGSRRVIKQYNSSVMLFRSGEHSELYSRWNKDVTLRLWGDQDWIAEQLPNQLTMPARWFPRISTIEANVSKLAGARVVLCKKPKNHDAVALWPWVKEIWR
jgi:hypothetical protein